MCRELVGANPAVPKVKYILYLVFQNFAGHAEISNVFISHQYCALQELKLFVRYRGLW
jgi:hypothetical protein